MKWVIAGGTGFIGESLVRMLESRNQEVHVLSRWHHIDREDVHFHKWTGKDEEEVLHVLNGADVLINLSGESVDNRYSREVKQRLYDSRIQPTVTLGRAMSQVRNPPSVWLQMSSATFYADCLTGIWFENGEEGVGFSVDLVKKWEESFNHSLPSFTRGVIMRTSIVLSKNGGAYPHYRRLAKLGVRGFGGRDLQFSWISELDLGRVILELATNPKAQGVYNLASAPCSVRDMMDASIDEQGGLKLGSLPSWSIEFGALLMRTEPELLLKSRSVQSQKLVDLGFEFRHAEIRSAIHSIETSKVQRPQQSKHDWVSQ